MSRLARRLVDIAGKRVSPTLHITDRQRVGDPLVFVARAIAGAT